MDNNINNWESEIIYPKKGQDIQYAYMELGSDEVVECTNEELMKLLGSKKKKLSYITTPEHDGFIIPGSDYSSLVPILNLEIDELEEGIKSTKPVFYLSIGLIFFNLLMGSLRSNSISFLMFVLVIIPHFEKFYDLRKIRKISEKKYFSESQNIKFEHWLKLKKLKSIYVFIAAVLLIFLFQFYLGILESAEIAGLDKSKTINGEYWRIITAIMMHANILHVLINGLVLFYIGIMVIRITDIYVFSLVSLFSGVLGNLFSVYFVPSGISVGASGAIMGLIGFVIVMGIKFKKSMPQKVTTSMIRVVMLTAFLGLVAWGIIDNAAHVGGLIGGVLMGFIILSKHHVFIPIKTNFIIKFLGFLSLVILLAGFLLLMWIFSQNL